MPDQIHTIKIAGLDVAQKYVTLFYSIVILILAVVGAWYSFDNFVMTKADAEEQHKETAEELLHLQAEMARGFKYDNFAEREELLLARITNRELDLEFFFKIPEDQRTERDTLIMERIKDQIDADTRELEQVREDRDDYRITALDPEDDGE